VRRWVWVLAVPLLAACSQVDSLQQVSGVPLATVEIAAEDVLVAQNVRLLSAPACVQAGDTFTCAGTTLDDQAIEVEVPDDDAMIMTVKVGGAEIFRGPVQEVIDRAGERTS